MNEAEAGAGPATAVFVVRVWREVSLSGVRWYGRVEWLDTKQSRYFHSLAQLHRFLQETGLFTENTIRNT